MFIFNQCNIYVLNSFTTLDLFFMTQKDIAINFLNKVAFGDVQTGYDLYTLEF